MWAGAHSSGSGSSEAHLAELQQKVGDDGSSGCGGEDQDDGYADGSSGVERRWPAAVCALWWTSGEDQATEEILVAEVSWTMWSRMFW